ncbi:MAG: antitoxin, Phd family protein [Alphaproteobacteria bacterium CG_4_10_14_0_2_um_filter_63_37]|nr:MAG: antitoxin, Phd family protein [Proteobacteria bacterium CG1_02_64_396]PJA25403.1 MAG: antitoxin, Phd family protein [Alphaproteobacteria bacterium CG_4_10_14_0_2_um_filter_63_37]
MRYSTQVKPISQLKARAAELLSQLNEDRQPLIITQNGEAKAVLQDIATFEQTQETLALLKILALGHREIETGRVALLEEAAARLRDHADLKP